ncbi:unnamed protein product [Albugo candida]|uniref:Uncharacterized protein n=1 Tax=Albugo candida TaxID=65357 RepID=A0A024GH11_9STRA|nr:unnamed protein product [Albugo candida]|eukprot:CCI45960.1 unnamed protein product [Albugo candida]
MSSQVWSMVQEYLLYDDTWAFALTSRQSYQLYCCTLPVPADSAQILRQYKAIANDILEIIKSSERKLSSHKPRRIRSSASALANNICCVGCGLRLSCLLDGFVPEMSILQKIIFRITKRYRLQKIIILQLDLNFFLINVTHFVLSKWQSLFLDFKDIILMDARAVCGSPQLLSVAEHPIVFEKIKNVIQKLCSDLLGHKRQLRNILRFDQKDTHGLGLCTLAGLILNYPAVYYLDSTSDHNCLSMCPLLLLSVGCRECIFNEMNGSTVLYSFSIPISILETIQIRGGCDEHRQNTGLMERYLQTVNVKSIHQRLMECSLSFTPFIISQYKTLSFVAL